MYTIIVDFTNFSLKHGVYVINVNGETVKSLHLPTTALISYIGSEEQINNVKLLGPKEYCKNIKEEIETALKLEYNKNNITVEVI